MNDKQTLPVPVAEGPEYALHAADDGSAFTLRCKADGLTAHLQGDDASRFRADYETIRLQFPSWSADQMLAQLWDQGGYSWLAAEDAR
jgi:hypothetical protein